MIPSEPLQNTRILEDAIINTFHSRIHNKDAPKLGKGFCNLKLYGRCFTCASAHLHTHRILQFIILEKAFSCFVPHHHHRRRRISVFFNVVAGDRGTKGVSECKTRS